LDLRSHFDGYRALALRGGPEIKLLSRNQKDLGKKFPEILDAIASLDIQDAVVDGEIVALDDQGRSSFQALQAFDMDTERSSLVFYASDLLRLNGKDLRDLPIEARKAKLAELPRKPPGLNSVFCLAHRRHQRAFSPGQGNRTRRP
jgi:bifunctional non-homologous end joining protein LigD